MKLIKESLINEVNHDIFKNKNQFSYLNVRKILKGKSKKEVINIINNKFKKDKKIRDELKKLIDFFMNVEIELKIAKNNLIIFGIKKSIAFKKIFNESENIWNENERKNIISTLYGLFDLTKDPIQKIYFSTDLDSNIKSQSDYSINVNQLINSRI